VCTKGDEIGLSVSRREGWYLNIQGAVGGEDPQEILLTMRGEYCIFQMTNIFGLGSKKAYTC
jgi:hypothetical protein